MSLISTIKDEQIAARKNRDKQATDLLTALLGEASIIGKNAGRETTDEEAIAVVKKFIKGIDETLAVLTGDENLERRVVLKFERALLSQFLPEQLSADQIREALTKAQIVTGKANKGAMMKFLKEHFHGQYDGKVAAQVIDELLKA